jgi:signal transduction histidine kinase
MRDLKESRDEFRRIADEQAALRRVATLVARGVSPEQVFSAVASELGGILQVENAVIWRFEPDHTMVEVGSWSVKGSGYWFPVGTRRPLDEPSVAALVWQTGQPTRRTDYATATGEIAAWARNRGITSIAGCPIVVEGRLWGAMVGFSPGPEPLPEDVEERMQEFTELVATAIANAQARTQLAESRARVVAASDETRRRIERDLHDGTQQRLVSLALQLRAAEAVTSPEQGELRKQLSHVVEGLASVMEDLQELSRGLHPAILSKAGLEPALKMLARRSAVPVEINVSADRRLAERVETTAYYIVSEALANVAKHARASVAHVDITMEKELLRISVRDDGIGGADPHRGSGLIGLRDRVEALGGGIDISSPPGGGTSLLMTIPIANT